MTSILVVDPDVRRRAGLRSDLERHGFGVVEADGRNLVEGLDAGGVAAIVAHAQLPAGGGIGLVPLARPTPVILFSEDANIAAAVSAVREGAADYLAWPASADALAASVQRAATPRAEDTGAFGDGSGDWPILGSCPAMLDLFERIRAAARMDVPVLVKGESGTGKELVARALHARGPRRQAPMITLNCAAIPEALIDAELFGHLQADAGNAPPAGLVAAAAGGTLFLNEVGELPATVQERLLDILRQGGSSPPGEAGSFSRGAGPSRSPAEGSSPDVRVIAATQRNLELLVEHGQFRSDLLERLGGVTLHVPPLRERGGDIVFLARVLARRAAARMSKAEPRFSNDAVAAIEAYQWPGNVRELENAVERAAILADAGEIHAALLAIDASPREPDAGALPVDGEDAVSLEEYFVRFVTEYQDQYTETELASRLGISRKNLWERRKRHGIPRRRTRKRGPRHDPG